MDRENKTVNKILNLIIIIDEKLIIAFPPVNKIAILITTLKLFNN